MKPLSQLLENWTEPDDAMYLLACSLSMMEYYEFNDEKFPEYYRNIKVVFASKNRIGTMLYEILEKMFENGLLEKRDDWEFRWNKSFLGYWEGGNDGRF